MKLTSVAVSPATASLAKGTSQALVATAIFSNDTKQDVTARATWVASSPSVLSFQSPGVAKGLAVGASEVTATFQGVTGKATLSVTAAQVVALSVTPFERSVPKGVDAEFTATAIFTDATAQDVTHDATWSTSSAAVAIFTSSGAVKALAEGTARITASLAGKEASTALEVTAAQLVTLVLEPANASLAKGLTRQMKAWGHFTDESAVDLTKSVVWCEIDMESTDVATISNDGETRGLVTARNVGKAEICASYCSTFTARTTLTVTPAVITSLTITPPVANVPKGLTVPLAASAVFSDGSAGDVTGDVVWSSSNEGIATVSNADDAGVATGLAVGGPVTLTARAPGGDVEATAALTVTEAVVVAVTVTPGEKSVAKGDDAQFTAMGTFSDGGKKDVTGDAIWESGDEAVALVSNAAGSRGLAHGLAKGGPVEIRATYAGKAGAGKLAVTDAVIRRLEISPATGASIPKGLTQQFTAQAVYSDGTVEQDVAAAWTSPDERVATIASSGLAHGVAVGNVFVRAAYRGLAAEAPLEVREAELTAITVEPLGTASIPKGLTRAFKATGHYTDGSSDITSVASWTSDPAVAQVSNADGSRGVATGTGVGTARITASKDGIEGSAELTVTREELVSIRVEPPAPILPLGLRQQFTAWGVYTDQSEQDLTATVTWSASSTPEGVALVHNECGSEGDAETLAVGEATVTATYPGTLKSGMARLEVTAAVVRKLEIKPFDHSMAKGLVYEFYQAWATYTDGSYLQRADVTFGSSNPAVATISNEGATKGKVFAVGAVLGETIISATLPDSPITATTRLTVTPAELLRVEVHPDFAERAAGYEAPFTATAVYTDGPVDVTAQAEWISSDWAIASVDGGVAKGVVKYLEESVDVTLTAAFGGKSDTATFRVKPALLVGLNVQPESPSIPRGETATYEAIGSFSDGTTLDLTGHAYVTWSVAPDGPRQVAKGVFETDRNTPVGTYTVTATANAPEGQFSGSTALIVNEEALVWVELVPPADLSMPKGLRAQFEAKGWFTDGTFRSYTGKVTWSSEPEDVASFNCAECLPGQAKGNAVGSATISALDSASGKAAHVGAPDGATEVELVVTAAELVAIAVTPPYALLPAGLHQQFTATGTYTDGDVRDLTDAVIWESSSYGVADVSNAFGGHGEATALAVGTATIRATFPVVGISGEATFDVSAALLDYLYLEPAPPAELPEGLSFTFRVMGMYTDGPHVVDGDPALALVEPSGVLALALTADGVRATAGDCPAETCLVTITASLTGWDGNPVTVSRDLTIVPEVVTALQVQGDATMSLGESDALAASVTWSLSGTLPTDEVTLELFDASWNPASFATASVNASSEPVGDVVVQGVAPGDGFLVVTYCGSTAGACRTDTGNAYQANVPVHVGPAVLYRLLQQPDPAAMPSWIPPMAAVYPYQWLKLMGEFSDGVRDLTYDSGTSWSSDGVMLVAYHPSLYLEGVVTGAAMAPGNGSVWATYMGQTATWSFTATEAELQGLAFLEASPIRLADLACAPFHPMGSFLEPITQTSAWFHLPDSIDLAVSGPIDARWWQLDGWLLEVCGHGVAGTGAITATFGPFTAEIAVEVSASGISSL